METAHFDIKNVILCFEYAKLRLVIIERIRDFRKPVESCTLWEHAIFVEFTAHEKLPWVDETLGELIEVDY